jgi:outer membrane protein OmpA-like peptidoglycan-associated protein
VENVVTNSQVYEHSLMRFVFVATSLLLIFCLPASGQSPSLSKKNKDLLAKAQKAWQARQLETAQFFYEKILESQPEFPESYLRLAQLADLNKETGKPRTYFQRLVHLQPNSSENAGTYHWLGKDAFNREKYDSAGIFLEKAVELLPAKTTAAKIAENMLASARFAREAILNHTPIIKKSLGDTVNALRMQYFPTISADERTLIFTGQNNQDENIYVSTRNQNGQWNPPSELSGTINTTNNEGTCTISADGRTLVFTACNRFDGYGNCDLYFSQKKDHQWTVPQNLGATVNSRYWESQPSLSADGKVLYFSSERPGGLGQRDIWKTTRTDNNKWSTPVNLGSPVNSSNHEQAPFIHANGNTLFFSSDRSPGMGGLDIYLSKQADTTWSMPVNLGYPVNTSTDQVGLIITADGRTGYYTDDQASKADGRALLYTFELPETLRKLFTPTRYVKGVISDSQTKHPLEASIELFDLNTGRKISQFESQSGTGEFLFILNQESDYALYITKMGYLFKSRTFSLNESSFSSNLDIALEAIQTNKVESLNNIFFPTGDYTLDNKSQVELEKLVYFLQTNQQIKIEISGHTDDVGSAKDNLTLSQKRAESVTNFLKEKGISADRLSSKGYGETKPQVPNTNDENRKVNRRIEWRIL